MKAKNLIGKKFGRLTVVARGKNTSGGKTTWVCDCDCGKRKEKAVIAYDLESGKVQSCGCLHLENNKGRNITHNQTGTRLYRIWVSMHQRCRNPKNIAYKNYGGKGISVCDEWIEFVAFSDWALSHGYADNLTLDRIDCEDGYSPNNCRWATMKVQQNNRRNNHKISIGGVCKTIAEWSDLSGIPRATLEWRIKNNWAEHELFLPVNLRNKHIRKEMNLC